MINMNYLDYVPVIGYARFVDRARQDEKPFAERVEDAIVTGYVSSATFIAMTSIMGPTYGMVRVTQGVAMVAPAATLAAVPGGVATTTALTYDRVVNEQIRDTHYRTPYHGPFAGAFGTVV